jgi:hypothetical protein
MTTFLAESWLKLDAPSLAIVAGIAVAALVIIYFAIRFWLASTRPPGIQDVKTPTLDRMNLGALQHMAGESSEQDAQETEALKNEEAPEDLKAVVPPEESPSKK